MKKWPKQKPIRNVPGLYRYTAEGAARFTGEPPQQHDEHCRAWLIDYSLRAAGLTSASVNLSSGQRHCAATSTESAK